MVEPARLPCNHLFCIQCINKYFETKFGRIVDGKAAKGRYVRGYTKGGSLSALNCWQEIEVYALPGKSQAAIWTPSVGSVSTPATVIVEQTEVAPVKVVAVDASITLNNYSVQKVTQQTVFNSVQVSYPATSKETVAPVNRTLAAPENAPSATAIPVPVAASVSMTWFGVLFAVFSGALLVAGFRALARDPLASTAFVKAK